MYELDCILCEKIIVGRGVILMNEYPDEDSWEKYAKSFPSGVQYMLLHPTCFEGIWQSICQIEDHRVAMKLFFGPVEDLMAGLFEDEET